jgi:hypothetical protein
LDTRSKIVSVSEARALLARERWLVIAGYFDPLTAIEADWVAQCAENEPAGHVMAVVLEGGEDLLSADVRVLMIAALRAVSVAVVASLDTLSLTVPKDERIQLICAIEEDRQRSRDFIELVLSREHLASTGPVKVR